MEMGFYVETISSGHKNGILHGDHMQWTEKWVYTWRPYGMDIEMGF